MTDQTDRAKSLAARVHPMAAASTKGGPVRFGMARNLDKPTITIPAAEFDAMSDEAVIERLRGAWGL